MAEGDLVSAPRDAEVGGATLGLVLTEHERFAAFVRRRLKDPSQADDVLQTAYARVLAKDAGPRDRTRVTAWFFRVLRRTLLDHLRSESSERRRVEARGRMARLSERDETSLRAAVCECVSSLLPTLKPEHADLLRRVELEGTSVRAAADALGISPNNAAVRVHRARKALAERLKAVCGACTEHGCMRCTCRDRIGREL